MSVSSSSATPDAPSTAEVTLFWRPGCGFCMALERQFQKHGIEPVRHNIWDDPEAAAFVRSVANGNEVVPTVVVGDRAMVNPSVTDVLEAMAG